MQTATPTTEATRRAPVTHKPSASLADVIAYAQYQIIRRNGAVVPFEPSKIAIAMMKAFLAVHGTQGAASASVRETVDELTQGVVRALLRSRPGGGTFHIEDIQDQVELGLMRGSHHEVARAYVLYRERRSQERQQSKQTEARAATENTIHVVDNGQRMPLNMEALRQSILAACEGLNADVRPEPILAETIRNLYDGVPFDEVQKAAILAARTLIEKEPDYTYATSRLLLQTIAKEVLGRPVSQAELTASYAEYFPTFIKRGVEAELLDERLAQYDLTRLGEALKPDATSNSTTSACRHFTTATSCTSVSSASNCPRRFSCGLLWAWHSKKSTAKRVRSSSTKCFPALTSCRAHPPCSTAAP